MTEKHQGWVASLSNGETVFEGEQVPGERTPWGKLIERCEEEGLWVTQLQLQIDGKSWMGIKKADGYCWFRDATFSGIVAGTMNQKNYAGIGSVIGEVVYCTVVDDQLQSRQETRPLASMRAHCVLKPAQAIAGYDEFVKAQVEDIVDEKHPLLYDS